MHICMTVYDTLFLWQGVIHNVKVSVLCTSYYSLAFKSTGERSLQPKLMAFNSNIKCHSVVRNVIDL